MCFSIFSLFQGLNMKQLVCRIMSHLHVENFLTCLYQLFEARHHDVLTYVLCYDIMYVSTTVFITQSSYLGYMFQLIDQSSSGLFSGLSHVVLCKHWDPSVFTSMKYISSDQLPKEVWCTYCVTMWLKYLKSNIWRLPAKNQVPLPSNCCLGLWGLFTIGVRVSPLLLLLRGKAHVIV